MKRAHARDGQTAEQLGVKQVVERGALKAVLLVDCVCCIRQKVGKIEEEKRKEYLVGCLDGCEVGREEGCEKGCNEGCTEGCEEGCDVGSEDGLVGFDEG